MYKGYSPLHLAAMNGHEPVIKYLIANGADLNATSSGGTPLHLAIEWEGAIMDLARGTDVYWHKLRNNKTAKLLISEGADLNMTQGGGETILYKNITDISADFLEYLVANGADVNMKNAKGFTPLHRAVASRSPSPKKIEFLISHGAKVNARTKAGTTPLDWVIENKKISDLLRKHGGKTSEELKTQESE